MQQEQATLWRDPELGDLEIMHASYRTHAFAPHRHASFVTSVIDRGVGTLRYRGKTWIAPAGSLVVLNPDEIHTGAVYGAQGWSYRALYPGVDLLAHVVEAMSERSAQLYFSPIPILADPTLAVLLQRLNDELAGDAPLLERETWLLRTYAYLFSRYAERPIAARPIGKEPRAVQLARDYLEAHYEQNISLAQLAQISGLSSFQLVRVFHRAVGLPPHAYLNLIRLERSKQLLLDGAPIASVAYETGFADQSHFTRRFKHVYGVTPGHVLQGRKNVQDTGRRWPV
jgi:AraC-like DNA-binding protein